MPLRKPPAPPGGKTPPSAGPSRVVGERPVADGRRRIDLARSLAPGYNFWEREWEHGLRLVLRSGRSASCRAGHPDRLGRCRVANQIEPNMSASGHPSSGFSGVRRRIPRYSVAIPVDITVLRSGAPASIPGRSLDLGEGGVAAVLAAELQLGEWVAVEFLLPNAGQALQTKAVVRHHNHFVAASSFWDCRAISDP